MLEATETIKVIFINSMKQLENAKSKAAEVANAKGDMFMEFFPAKNKGFGFYYVEGSNAYHLVHLYKIDGKAAATCSCVALDVCYHIGAVADYHMLQVKKLEAAKKVYVAPVTDANSAIGLAAKANAEKIMKEIKAPEVFKFEPTHSGDCMWCEAPSHLDLDDFEMCLVCAKKGFEARQNIEIKPTNHTYDKYKKVNGKIKLGEATKAYAKGGMLD